MARSFRVAIDDLDVEVFEKPGRRPAAHGWDDGIEGEAHHCFERCASVGIALCLFEIGLVGSSSSGQWHDNGPFVHPSFYGWRDFIL
jgi:hypothetical protein